MSRIGSLLARFGTAASRGVRLLGVGALSVAVVVMQLGVLAGARTALGARPVLSWAGLFAALATTQVLVYGLLIVASVGRALGRLDAAGRGERVDAGRLVGDDVRVRLWLVGWLVVAMALRAALAHGIGVDSLLASP